MPYLFKCEGHIVLVRARAHALLRMLAHNRHLHITNATCSLLPLLLQALARTCLHELGQPLHH
jgi:hypothetical protein